MFAVLTNERHGFRRGRHGVCNKQHEDRVGQEYRDAQRDLLARVHRQAEGKDTEDVQPETREHNIQHVIQDPPLDHQDYCHVWVHRIANRIHHLKQRDQQVFLFLSLHTAPPSNWR